MNTIYIVDGQEYSVGSSKLEQFFEKFPNAVKKGKEQGLTVDPTMGQDDMGSQLDDGSLVSQEELSDSQQFSNVFKNAKLGLQEAWESTKIAGAQFSSYLGAGDEEETDKYIVDQYKKLDEISAKMGDTGKGIVKGVKEGDFADVGIGVVNALTSVITTVAPAMLTRGASLVPQIMAPMYTEYNSEKAKALYGDDEERAIEKLIENNEDEVAIPMALGAASVALEKIGIKGISKYVLNNAKTKGARRIADLTLTGNREGLTEYFQGGLNVANKSLAQGDNAETVSKKVFDHMSSEDALEEYVQGFVGGAGMSAGGRKINSAFRDKNDNKIVNDYVNAIGALNQQKVSSKTEDAKNAIDKKIKQTEQSFKNFLIQNKKRSEYLTEDQATEAINILDTKKELNVKLQNINNQLKNNEINKNEHSIILEDINNQFETNNKKLNDIKVEANKKLLHDDLRISNEAISKIKGLSQNIYKTPEDFLKALNAKSKKQYTLEEIQSVDGLVVGKEILINETIAAENNAVTVGSHELLHAIVKSSITGKTRKVKDVDGNTVETDLTEDGAILIKDFLNELNSKENKIVQERIDTNYRYNRNKKGEIVSEKAFEQYAEEYLNAYADAAIKNELSDSVLEKLGKFLQKIFNNGDNGYKDLSFKTGKDVKTFLKSYVSDRKKGSFRQQFVDMAQEGAGKETTIIKKSLTKKGLNTQQVTDKVNKLGRIDSDGNNLQEKGIGNFLWEAESDAIVKEIKEEGYIDNLIAKQYKVEDVPVNFVNDVITQLIPDIKGFKPEQNDSFFAYLNSRIKFRAGDVYNKLYKGDEAIKGAKDIGKTTKEGEVKVQVAAETDTAMEALETEDLSPAARAKKKADKAKGKEKVESKFRKQLGIETGGKLYNKVLDSAKKALLRAYEAGTSVRNIQRKLRDEANVYLFKEIKNLLGTKKYISNLKEFRIPIIEAIFTADLIQIERNVPENKRVFTKFVKKLTSKAEVQAAVDQNLLPASALNIIDKGTAVSLYEKVMPTENQFVSFFDQPLKTPALDNKGNQMMKDGFSLMIRSGLKGTRKDALTKAMAGALSYDATMQVAQEQDVIEKREQLAALKGETLAEDNLETLAAAIGRDPNIKFSKSNENRIVSNMAGEILSLVNEMSADPSLITFENGIYKINQNIIKKWTRKAKFKKSDEAIIAEFAYKMYRDNTYGKLTNFELAKKVLKDVIKARKNKYDLKVNQAFEQLVISSLQYAVKNINSRLKTNKKVKEGIGQGDAYISFNRNILGIEVKMNEADGVSQTVNIKVDGDGKYSLTYANPNPTINENKQKFDDLIGKKIIDATQQLNSDLKKAGLGPIAENTMLTKAQIKFIEDNVLKTQFLQHMEISPEYAMWHYGNAKYQNKPQGFIQVGESLYRMITGNSKIDKLSLAIQQEYKGTIPDLSMKKDKNENTITPMEMVARLKIDNGKLKWRISPRIIDTQLAQSKVNLLNPKDANAFVKAADKVMVNFSKSQDAQTIGKAVQFSRSANNPTKGITVLDFDDTLATTKSLVKFTRPDGTTGTLNAEQYASTYENLLDQGYTFDFSEFNKVVKGKLAPLFQKALKLQGKFGPENMFVLTARPPQAAKAIFDFLKANGLNIPIKNITGLGNSTAEAKALWIADKVGEGFNDFYFADDALQNVQAVDDVLSQLGVKRKVQQAKVKFSKSLGKDLAKNKNYKKFRNSLKGSVLYHGGTASLSDNKAVWFTASDFDGAELYAERRDGKVYSINSNNLNNAIIIPDVSDLIGLEKIIKNKHKSIAKEVFDEYGQVDIKKVLETDVASEVISDFMDYINNNFELLDGVYGPETLYDNDGKISKGIPVIVLGGNVSTKVSKVKFSKSIQTIPAVANMLDQFDVKSKVQQAKVKFSKSMNDQFNDILENVTGIDSVKRFSEIKGRKRGDDKGKFRLFIPPSHEDFVGLLYNFMGKGKEGNAHRDFFEKALVRPLNRAYREIDTAKQAIANDYKSLGKRFPKAAKALLKKTKDGDFTFQDAVRVYLWNKHGYKIPGLTPTDQQKLVDLVNSMPGLKSYAENVNIISKQEKYVDPGPNWETGNIRIDLIDATGRVGRAQYFTEFNENAETIFSPENLNKIEAAYGKDFREALEDMLHRIKTGVNRPKGASAKPNMFMNWLNASVSGVMFFNTRSALLQQMSNVNFLNFADNNIYAAGKAFADQPQYWKDFAMIFNSDMLKQRRGGLQTDINGAELAEAIKKARPDNVFDQVAIITGKALRLGFLPTQIGDNIAIATGGAAFYRNRVNKYIEDGMSVKEAEAAAFTDFQNITQSTQQSARPDMTSQQQASWIGKLVLNFLNTPSQYNRIIKKAGSDIINRRITPPNTTQMQSDMSNMSRILYYGAAQNLIFYGLQTALFAVMFGDDEEDNEAFLKKKERVINGSIDTILRGSGIYGVAVSTLKNMIIKFAEQREKGYNKDESAVIMELANFSPVVGIKLRKIVNAEKTLNYNKKVIDEMETFDIDNPQWSAVTNYVEAITTAPTNRIYQKTINLRNASDNQYTAFQRALFFSGYTTWSLNLGDTEKMKDIKESVKGKKKTNTRSRTRTRTRSRTRAR